MTAKYEHLFVRHMQDSTDDLVNEGAIGTGEPRPSHIGDAFALMRAADVPGSKIHMTYSWINPTDEPSHWVNEHEHDYDEVLIWTGSDQENPHDLGGELLIDLDGETYSVTTSGALYIPAGLRHCPLDFKSVSRPIRFSALSLSGDGHYRSDENVPKG